jgi:RHS repeat-associated protein
MAWKPLAVGKLATVFVSVLLTGLVLLSGAATAQTFTRYNYTGKPLSLWAQNAPHNCPASVGNITATVDYYNSPTLYAKALCQVKGGTLESAALGWSNFIVNASGTVSYTYFFCSHLASPSQPDKIAYIYSGPLDQYDDATFGPGWCVYKNTTTPGTWSGPMSVGPAKMLGAESVGCPTEQAKAPSTLSGNPINAATGNKVQTETDVACASHTGLRLARTYNSQDTGVSAFGARWRDAWHRALVISGTTVTVTRADGRQDIFTKNGAVYTSDPDVTSVLKPVLNGTTITAYQLTTAADVTETYAPSGQLLSVTTRSGLTTTLAYSGNNLAKVTGPFGHVLSFTYTSGGQVATMTGPDGGVYTYSYDANFNLVSVTWPDKSVRKYVYENATFPNFLMGIIDENGVRYATYAYDTLGRAVSSQHAGVEKTTIAYTSATASTVTDPRGNARTYGLTTQFSVIKPASLAGPPLPELGGKTFTYDANGFIASRTDYNGRLTTYTHDARGNETSRVEASGTTLARTISTTWLPNFHLPAQITEPNRNTAFTYDGRGNLLTLKITAGALTRSVSYTYSAVGQKLTATDPRGNVTRYAYDAKGGLASVTDALGHVTNITSYDGNGRPLTILDPNGVTTSLTYDARGRLTSRTTGTLKTIYAYDKVGNLVKVTLPDAASLTYSYDSAHRLTGIADALGNHITYTLDAASNRTREEAFDSSGALARTRSYAYDAVNRLSQSLGAQGQTTAYSYDLQSNLTKIADPLNHQTSYAYDALNRVAQAIDPNGGATLYGYDVNDHLASVTDPRALKTAYTWDGLDDQTALTSPDTGITNITFDTAGNVATSTDARGKKTTYTYDALNRLTKAAFADGTSTVWLYDQGANGIGRLGKITDVTGSTAYSYDANGHVTKKIQTIGARTLTTSYGYDSGGRLASVTYPSGKQAVYAYDVAGRVGGVTLSGQTLVKSVTYTPFGNVSGWTAGNGAAYRRTIDLDGRITGLALPAGDTITLAYDTASRITGLTESALAAQTFGYDALDRLTNYKSGTATQTYTYDADGNRTSYATNGTSPVSLTYNVDKTSNRLLGIGGTWAGSFTYDSTGNMLSYQTPFAGYTFSYDARSRLTQSFVGAIGTPWLVNGLGQRVGQYGAGAPQFYFAYDEVGHLIGKYDASGAVHQQETVWLGDLPIAVLSPATQFYIAPDHLGAPHQITDATSKVAWLWSHDPFGKDDPSGTLSYDLRFPGQFFDQATHLHYNYFRDYDPRTGRYIESDPIGLAGGINTYGYVSGNPLTRIDPRGHEDVLGTFFQALLPAHTAAFSRSPIGGSTQAQLEYGNQVNSVRSFEANVVALAIVPGAPEARVEGAISSRLVCKGVDETTTLFRAVTTPELKSIQSLKAFSNPAGIEVKYFSTSLEGAQSYASQATSAFGDGPFTFVQTRIPTSSISPEMAVTVDRGIPTIVVPTEQLPSLSEPGILDLP